MAKGIRVNQLAKELGVESKAILRKLQDEGLGDKAPNHMSVLPLGLAESVKEWFSAGGGGTAVETAAPVEVAVKPKRVRTAPKRKTADDLGEQGQGHSDHADDLHFDESVESATSTAEEVPAPETTPEAPSVVQTPETPSLPETVEPAPPIVAPPLVEAPIAAPTEPAPAPAATPVAPPPPVVTPPSIAATAATPTAPIRKPVGAGPARPQQHGAGDAGRPHVNRPTVTLGPTRGAGSANIERKPVTVAPQLKDLKPATIQGPKVVRVEAPENLPAPRARRPMGGGPGDNTGPAVFRPQTGRGVKVTEEEEEGEKKKAAGKGGRTLSGRRRGPDGRRGEAEEKLREFTEADLLELRERLQDAGRYHHGMEERFRRSGQRGQHLTAKSAAEKGAVEIEEPITLKSLSAVLGIKSNDILRKLFMRGVHGVNINSTLDRETAELMALEYGVAIHVVQQATMEEELMAEFDEREQVAENLRPRPPVVTILGHVDHGKTSLLDKIRNANVAAGEAGGITQHTAAWMVELEREGVKRHVTFVDTPGHQAFTSMRARGAQVTDVVVLVVSAAEGVQPQTVESINHARAANVPIVVALNKIDRPDANPDMVLGQLAKEGLNPVEWGGETEVVRTSAVTGQGIPDLLEILDYQSELLDLKADPSAEARGTVIESRVDAGLGPVATVLVQDGTLKLGDVILAGPGYGRIRSLLNDRREMIEEAGPSTPVIVSGLNELPASGDKFFVIDDFERARSIAEERQLLSRESQLGARTQVSLANLNERIKEGATKTINLIIKGDVHGSVETLAKTVTDQNTEEVRVRVIHAAVGGITESDVELADASAAVIIGFNVVPDEAARSMAEQRHVEVRLYRVIYEIFDDLKKALSGMLEPEVREKLHGHLEVRQVFKVSRIGNIGGCFCTDGHVQRGSKIRLIRDGRVVSEDIAIESLKRMKDDVREVKAGFECGVKLAGYDDIKTGDVLEAYIRETFQRTL